MSPKRDAADLIVVGAGVIGLSVAWRAAARGLRVTVLERDDAQHASSRVAAGMLAPVSEMEFGRGGRRLLALGMRSAALWPAFASELEAASGEEVALLATGTLMVARDADEARELERQIELRSSLGLRAMRLLASQARELEPRSLPRSGSRCSFPTITRSNRGWCWVRCAARVSAPACGCAITARWRACSVTTPACWGCSCAAASSWSRTPW
jgi:glycine/D-amino acid oxidase-like deaminating enzyme